MVVMKRDDLLGTPIASSHAEEDRIMPFVYIVLVLMAVGVALWLINTYIPMAGSIKAILNAVVVVVVCIWVLQAFGIWTDVLHYRVTR